MIPLAEQRRFRIIETMSIRDRLLQWIDSRHDGLLRRHDVTAVGSRSQVSAVLGALCREGVIRRIERGVYVDARKPVSPDEPAVGGNARQRQTRRHAKPSGRRRREGRFPTPTARHVAALAKRLGVSYAPIYSDEWAATATRLAGDDVAGDATDDLLVALTRAGRLTPGEMVRLVMEHHRALKPHV